MFFYASIAVAESSSTAVSSQTFHLKKISFLGVTNEKELKQLQKIASPYLDKNVTIESVTQLKKELAHYYKSRGMLFRKVVLLPQDLSDGVLQFSIIKTKVGKININGNKYYSKAFILRNLAFSEGGYLYYNAMLESLLLLNSYEDLSIKSYLKKGEKFATTDVYLDVKDTFPFHATVTFDNLGSKNISKSRVSVDSSYGNLINDGDKISSKVTFGIDSLKSDRTKLLLLNYETTPLGRYFTRLHMGYLYADYITAGDLSVLELKGDTYKYSIGLSQPLFYTATTQIKSDLDYARKHIKSYLLGSLSSDDEIGMVSLSLSLEHKRVFDGVRSQLSVIKGISGDDSQSSRYGAKMKFLKFTFKSSYNRYINKNFSLFLSLDGQYSHNRLPLSELYTIGGLSSVRGYEPAQKLGDSGYLTTAETFFHPELNYFSWLKNALQIGVYADYARVYNKRPVAGEEKASSLAAVGGELLMNLDKRYFARISVGYPLYASDKTINDSTHLYGYVGIKLW